MKETVLMKYGGASLATIGRIQKVANYVAEVAQTRQVVVVVSAMGDETDKLFEAVEKLYPRVVSRHDPELDKCLATGETRSASFLALAVTAAPRRLTAATKLAKISFIFGVWGARKIFF